MSNIDYLTGIADFFMYRRNPPKWMNNEVQVQWKKGWQYASTQLVNKPISRMDIIGQNGPSGIHYST